MRCLPMAGTSQVLGVLERAVDFPEGEHCQLWCFTMSNAMLSLNCRFYGGARSSVANCVSDTLEADPRRAIATLPRFRVSW